MMRFKLFPVTLLLLMSCSGHVAYRSSAPVETGLVPGNSVPFEDFPGYTLAFIEIDDSGDLWDDDQLYRALSEIHAANELNSNNGALVFAYVHGWKHNASDSSKNLESFRAILKNIAYEERSLARGRRAARHVVGVYFGWRGKSVRFWEPFISVSSYHGRNATATRVAGIASTEALYAVMKMARKNVKSRCVVIGHSMGALIVEGALIPAFQGLIIEGAVEQNDYGRIIESVKRGRLPGKAEANRLVPSPWRPPADLVILVNAASPALQAKKFINMLSRWDFNLSPGRAKADFVCSAESSEWLPLIVSITSKGDWATKGLFPVGNWVGALPRETRRYRDMKNLSPRGRDVTQRYLLTHTGGHTLELLSHEMEHYQWESSGWVVGKEKTKRERKLARQQAPSLSNVRSTCGELGNGRGLSYRVGNDAFVLTPGGSQRYNPTPYWIFQVPSSVIPNHGLIFEPEFYRMIKGLFVLAGIVRTSSVDQNAPPSVQEQDAFDLDQNASVEVDSAALAAEQEPSFTAGLPVPRHFLDLGEGDPVRRPDRIIGRPDRIIDDLLPEERKVSLVEEPSPVVKGKDGPAVKGPDGSAVKEPDGAVLKEPDGAVVKEPDGSVVKEPDGSVGEEPRCGMRVENGLWFYEVESGDYLIKIAEKCYGTVRWKKIFGANWHSIRNPHLIYPGQLLRLPQ